MVSSHYGDDTIFYFFFFTTYKSFVLNATTRSILSLHAEKDADSKFTYVYGPFVAMPSIIGGIIDVFFELPFFIPPDFEMDFQFGLYACTCDIYAQIGRAACRERVAPPV